MAQRRQDLEDLQAREARYRWHGVDMVVQVTEALPEVRGQRTRLPQVRLNQLSNARDALHARRASLSGDKTGGGTRRARYSGS